MKNIVLKYDPYRIKTTLIIDQVDVCEKNKDYPGFDKFIKAQTPLQTWLEPVPYKKWKGFLNEICDENRNDEIRINFTGRYVDFLDLKRILKIQNKARKRENQVVIDYDDANLICSDNELMNNIESVIKELKTDRFKSLVEEFGTEFLKKRYAEMQESYDEIKKSEFQIVFSGVYSSGKSTIINALIGHELLPSSDKTTTSKVCKIYHNKNLDGKFILRCKDKEKVIFEETFDNEDLLRNKFDEITPKDKHHTCDEYKDVDLLEIETNLKHLYPKKLKDDKFKIVLIDTPGTDSAQEQIEDKNLHLDITRDAIKRENKPMVVFCVYGSNTYSKTIGEFMADIYKQSEANNSGFNDRFLFVINKCDNNTYNNNENIQGLKNDYSRYLTDPQKWGSKTNGISEISFIPRIFPVSALVGLAKKQGADKFTKEEKRGDKSKNNKYRALDHFVERVVDEEEDYYLSTNCDIPTDRREEIFKEFKKAIEEERYFDAAEFQCGINALEIAIRDYIERYAFPVKVRQLLETFEDIISEISAMSKRQEQNINELFEKLGKNVSAREEEEQNEKVEEKRKNNLEKLDEIISDQYNELEKIQLDGKNLGEAKNSFRQTLENNDIIKDISNNEKISLGLEKKRKGYDDDHYYDHLTNEISKAFDDAIGSAVEKIMKYNEYYEEKFEGITKTLVDIKKILQEEGVFELDGYDFKNSSFWIRYNTKFNNSSIKKILQEKNILRENIGNKWSRSGRKMKSFIGKIVRIREDYNIEYETDQLRKYIQIERETFTNTVNQLNKEFDSQFSKQKENVKNIISSLKLAIEDAYKTLYRCKEKIIIISNDINELKKEKAKIDSNIMWLAQISERLGDF